MQITLDTNTLIRFFTRDIEAKAQKVKKLLDSNNNLFIPDVVFPELEYILSNGYNIDRTATLKFFKFLTSKNNIKSSKEAKRAVEIFSVSKFDMADCIIAASSFKGSLASFDKKLLQVADITPFWKQKTIPIIQNLSKQSKDGDINSTNKKVDFLDFYLLFLQ